MPHDANVSPSWVAVCASTDVHIEQAHCCVIEGRRLLVWRDGEGHIHVWADACPHRGVPLSLGVVSGGLISCPAHGWRFDTNGQRVQYLSMASQPPARNSFATVYLAKESEGMVWAADFSKL